MTDDATAILNKQITVRWRNFGLIVLELLAFQYKVLKTQKNESLIWIFIKHSLLHIPYYLISTHIIETFLCCI